MASKKSGKSGRPTSTTGRTRGEAPPEIRQRSYPPRGPGGGRGQNRSSRSSYHSKRNNNRGSSNQQLSRELDERLVELQALFEVSKTLNSSLQLRNILDTLLLTPMGKMMLGKGLVVLARGEKRFVVETLKGLPQSHIGQEIEIDLAQPSILFLNETQDGPTAPSSAWASFLKKLGLELIVPIIANNKCLGFMAFSAKIGNQRFTPNELEYLNSLANLAATAVENALIFQELKEVNRKLDKKIQELNTLFDIGRELNSTLESDKITSVLAYALMGELMVQKCFIFCEDDNDFVLKVNKGGEHSDLFTNSDFISWLKGLRKPLRVRATDDDQPVVGEPWQEPLEAVGGVLIVPLVSQDVCRGIIILGEKITKAEYPDDEIEFVSTLGNAAMMALENARLFKETLEKQRLEEELAIAREIQQKLLPKEPPSLVGYEISALNIPTEQVGGDYFDYFPIDSQRYVLSIADVSGKGVPAALIMSNLQATLRAMMTSNVPLEKIVARINNFVYANTTFDKFITFFVAVLDLKENTFTYVNAGHNPPYFFAENETPQDKVDFKLLDKGGLLLGMFPDAPYEAETLSLQNGQWIVMYTDGVNEAMNSAEEEFTESRIEETIHRKLLEKNGTAASMIDAITNRVREFTAGRPQSDDITLMALHYSQPQD